MIDTKQIQAMAELRRALQIFATTLYADDEAAMQIASIYPVWAADKQYKANDVISYGTNSVGDPQLYLVLQAHKSQSDWLPDATASLYKKMGISESGYPIWTQPLGAVDAYNIGDIVSYNGKLYKSIINANVWAPDVYPAGWEEYTESTSGGDSSQQVAVVQQNQKRHRLKQSQILFNQQAHMTHIRRAIKSSLKEKSIRA